MDQLLEAIFGWDIVNWSTALPFWDRMLPADLTGQTGLEIGAQQGGLSLWLASRNASVVCSDFFDPRSLAQTKHHRWLPDADIRYEAIDATRIPYENHFDIIAFKSVLGGISRPGGEPLKAKVVAEIHKALKPGGILLFAENGQGSLLHRLFRRQFVAWGKDWSYTSPQEMRELLSEFRILGIQSTGFLGAFGRSRWQRNLLGHLDRWLLNGIVGAKRHYIVYGAARKPA